MTPDVAAAPRWSTSTFAANAHNSAMEQSALAEHLELCKGLTGRLFALRCGANAIHCFVAPRVVTTLVVAALLMSVSL
jgi:hypothetical protein